VRPGGWISGMGSTVREGPSPRFMGRGMGAGSANGWEKTTYRRTSQLEIRLAAINKIEACIMQAVIWERLSAIRLPAAIVAAFR
jgi:hypothetical protein